MLPVTPVSRMRFILVGAVRSGLYPLQTALSRLAGVHCHGDIISTDKQRAIAACLAYFGHDVAFDRTVVSLGEYLRANVFDAPMRNELCIGVRLNYDALNDFDAYDFLAELDKEGDFCLIHVRRNPVACFVSLQQAKQSNTWNLFSASAKKVAQARPVWLETDELISFVRQHYATEQRVNRHVEDRVTLEFTDIVKDIAATTLGIAKFIEAPGKRYYGCDSRRINAVALSRRVANWYWLKKEVPQDVLAAMIEAEKTPPGMA